MFEIGKHSLLSNSRSHGSTQTKKGTPKPISIRNFIAEQLAFDEEYLTPDQLHKLEQNPEAWTRFFFPDKFDRQNTSYQSEFWKFTVDLANTREIDINAEIQPRIECEPRGVGKSTSLRIAIIYLLARKIKHYVLYVSATHNQAKKHVAVLRKLLENERLLKYYPHLQPQLAKHRNAIANWSADKLVTRENQVIEFISIMGNARGFNTDEGLRLDLIAMDDVDDQKDTADTVEKKLDIIGTNILPAGDETTDIIFTQNLIHRLSVCTRLRDNNAGILLNRHFVGAYPMCKHYDYVEEDVPGDNTGARQYRVLKDSFQPYDPATSREYVEKLLNRLGVKNFERECQQNMNLIDDEMDFREYSEIRHVITYSEFRNYFESISPVWNKKGNKPQIPSQWNVALGHDFGTTPGHPTAIFPVSRPNQNVPLNDSYFVFGEVVLPKYPHNVDKPAELVSPGRVMEAEKSHLKKWSVRDDQIVLRRMSHEQSAARNAYAEDLKPEYKTFYQKWKPARDGGVPQMQQVMEVDYTKDHPFRVYPQNHPDKSKRGKPLKGCPRFFIVVPDDQGKLSCDDTGNFYVAQPINADGCARLRAEIPVYSHFHAGKSKIFDDAVDAGRGVMGEFVLGSQDTTDDEDYRRHLENTAPELLPEKIKMMPDPMDRSRSIEAEQLARLEFYKRKRVVDVEEDVYNTYQNQQSEEMQDYTDFYDVDDEDDFYEL